MKCWTIIAILAATTAARAQLEAGDLLVACGNDVFDSGIHRISPDGTYRGVFASDVVNLHRPGGMAVGPAGQVFVASIGTGMLLSFNTNGSPAGLHGPTGDGSLVAPNDLISKSDGVLIADADGGAIQAFDYSFWNFVLAGHYSSGAGHMIRVGNVAYVSDPPGGVVWSFDVATGATSLVVKGQGLICPTGLAVDSTGRLYIADSYQDKLYRFAGGTLTEIATGPPLDGPRALLFNPDGELLVANQHQWNVLRYDTTGLFLGVLVAGIPEPTHLMYYSGRTFANGYATLTDCQDIRSHRLFVELRRTDDGTLAEFHGPLTLGVGGYFSFGTSLVGTYDVYAWSPSFLRRYIGRLHTAAMIGLGPVLVNGDINGDNEVEIGDYALLAIAFGTRPEDVAWDERCDLNCDLVIDIGDFAILSANFGQIGD
ncbi:MAG TPA: hypothetical protein PLL78_12735 [Fimbriimonadaceae bacterium]|nr:hypothetical protein [Fimbriimonadaceae bacterium]HRJ97544.1 hypothetical protein [Fimbriimonadaceae bacterium]